MTDNKRGGLPPIAPIDPKDIVHYYVDGGIKNGVAASAFVRKAFRQKPPEEVRRVFSTKVSSAKSEMRAIRLAVEDALSEGIDPSRVVIHTDQKSLGFNNFKRVSPMSLLREEIVNQGFNLSYIPSTHILEDIDVSKVPKKVLNALTVHNLVKSTLASGNNRHRYHLMKKRAKRRSKKRKH